MAADRALKPYTQPAPFHSQWGEDRWLAEHLDLPANGSFVDVGAGDGRHGSNTLYFETLGWHGLCIDADPRNHPMLRQRECAVETCAVSTIEGCQIFGMYIDRPSRSGLGLVGDGYRQTIVETHPLEALLNRWHIEKIDLLSIDVEGTELDVWRSFHHNRHRPAVVIIEYDDLRPDRHRDTVLSHLGRETYGLRHVTPANLILQRTDLMPANVYERR